MLSFPLKRVAVARASIPRVGAVDRVRVDVNIKR
jgi:hypothetical protein